MTANERQLVEAISEMREDEALSLAKAMLDVDDFQFTHRAGPGLKLTVSKRLH